MDNCNACNADGSMPTMPTKICRGNLAIFYRDFGYSRGLIQLGRIDSGIEALNVPGSLKVTIEPVAK